MTFPIFCGGTAAGSSAPAIQNALRCRASASPYANKTWAGTGNQKLWSIYIECKRGLLGTTQDVISVDVAGGLFTIRFNSDNTLYCQVVQGGAGRYVQTNAVFRDVSALLKILLALDAANGTAAQRLRLYVANTEITSFSTDQRSSITNADCGWNGAYAHNIGRNALLGTNHFDGVICRVINVDGQQLTPSAFGATDSNAGNEWKPKTNTAIAAAVGSFGTNGFLLDFADTASMTTLGYDAIGSNDWTMNNFSLTSGVTYDAFIDSPDNGASGTQPVGNYAVLNPLIPSAANITKANLASGTTAVQATLDANASGGSYWEVTAGGSAPSCGVISEDGTTHTTTVTANKVFGFRITSGGDLDCINITDAGTWTSITTGLTGVRFPYGVTQAADWNFGQRPFVGTPSGKALCTANLISTTITTSGSFTGNLSADGPSVFLNGVPTAMTINGNAVTWGTHAIKTAYGFKVISSSASYNNTGSNTFSVTSTGQPLKYANAQINP